MNDDRKITISFTVTEAKSLATAANLGMRSGGLLEAFKSVEEDEALVAALVKLSAVTKDGCP